MQPKTEQFACFTQTFTMALELVHHCHLRNQNEAQWVETYRLRGGNIITRSLGHVTKGSKIRRTRFFRSLQKKFYQNKVSGLILFHVSLVGRCTGDLIVPLKPGKVRFSRYVTVTFKSAICSDSQITMHVPF